MTQTTLRRFEQAQARLPQARHGDRWLGAGLILLGVAVAVTAVLGPLVAEVIRYHASSGTINQIVGSDIAALLLVAPVSTFAGVLALRGHLAAPVVALGPAVFTLYTYTQLALGGDFVRYPGNSERFFPLYLGLFVLAGAIAIRAWRTIDPADLPPTSPRLDRALGILLLVVAGFLVVGLHVPGLVDAWQDAPTGTEYLADPGPFWLVKFMDLGIVVPAIAAIGVGVLRAADWAHRAKYAAVGWFALLSSSVAGMAVVMQARGDAAASTANTVAFGLFAAIGLVIAIVVYRPLFIVTSVNRAVGSGSELRMTHGAAATGNGIEMDETGRRGEPWTT